jgi:hypothetical protein
MATHRLPTPGSDNGTWGDILNDFLVQAHNSDGSLQDGIITDAKVASSAAIAKTKLALGVQSSLTAADNAAPKPVAGTDGKIVKWNNTSGVLEDASAILNGTYVPRSGGTSVVVAGLPFLNVKDYGAVGDGTTDDGPAIRAALAALPVSGGTVWFPAGTFRLVATSTVTTIALATNTVLRGVKGASIINVDSDATGAGVFRGFAFNNGNDVLIDGLIINRVADYGGYFIDARAHDRFVMRDCAFNGNSDVYTTQGNTFFHLPTSGSMDGTVWDNCKVSKWRYGWVQDNPSTVTITNTVIRSCKFDSNSASDLEFNSPSGSMSGVLVAGCSFTNNLSVTANAGWGVGLAYIAHVRVENNKFSGYYGEAIHIEDYSSDIIIRANYFDTCAKSRAAYIYMFTGCNRIKIDGNNFDGTLNTTAGQAFVNAFLASAVGQVTTSTGTANVGSGVTLAVAPIVTVIPAGTALTFTGGGVLTTTANAVIGSTSLTGNLTTANISSGATATLFLTPSGHSSVAAPSYLSVTHNDFTHGTYVTTSVAIVSVRYAVVRGNTITGSGFVVSGNWTNPTVNQLGILVTTGSSSVIDANVLFGVYEGIGGTAAGNVIAFGHGSVVSNNSLTQCNLAIDARNSGAATITGNILNTCVRSIVTGTATTGSGTTAHPITVSGNVAYGCTNAMEIYNTQTVTATGAATSGGSVTLSVAALQQLIKSGTVLTFSGGGVLTLTADAAYAATNITGTLATANIASSQTAVAMSVYSTTAADNIFTASGNIDGVLGTSAYSVGPVVATRTVTVSTVINLKDNTIYLNGSSLTATLPPAAAAVGRLFTVKNINASGATVTTTGGTIDGSSTDTLAQYVVSRYQSDGTSYFKL